MAFFQKKIGPVFLKEIGDGEVFVSRMEWLLKEAKGDVKEEIEKQIKLAGYGALGEKNIAYELKNSGMDMYILHDVYFECGEHSAQIDYIIITRKHTYIVECKNLIGNIEIDSKGNFVRSYEFNGRRIKEGMYSPITQNERHRSVIKNLRMQEMNRLDQMRFEKSFDQVYRSIVVLANPKTYLNDRFAKKEIKNKVIRADQLVAYIKKLDAEASYADFSNDAMKSLAEFFVSKHVRERSDYYKKYEEMVKANKEQAEAANTEEKKCPKCGSSLILRTAKQGANAGRQFYGCSGYPKCRYIENI